MATRFLKLFGFPGLPVGLQRDVLAVRRLLIERQPAVAPARSRSSWLRRKLDVRVARAEIVVPLLQVRERADELLTQDRFEQRDARERAERRRTDEYRGNGPSVARASRCSPGGYCASASSICILRERHDPVVGAARRRRSSRCRKRDSRRAARRRTLRNTDWHEVRRKQEVLAGVVMSPWDRGRGRPTSARPYGSRTD